eukprot:947549-Amphidinium_carterae.2
MMKVAAVSMTVMAYGLTNSANEKPRGQVQALMGMLPSLSSAYYTPHHTEIMRFRNSTVEVTVEQA